MKNTLNKIIAGVGLIATIYSCSGALPTISKVNSNKSNRELTNNDNKTIWKSYSGNEEMFTVSPSDPSTTQDITAKLNYFLDKNGEKIVAFDKEGKDITSNAVKFKWDSPNSGKSYEGKILKSNNTTSGDNWNVKILVPEHTPFGPPTYFDSGIQKDLKVTESYQENTNK